ncbi:MAG TPA: FUSC family protein [Herbaspirillum sp.]|jgi:uncharacterized membrane protein YccC
MKTAPHTATPDRPAAVGFGPALLAGLAAWRKNEGVRAVFALKIVAIAFITLWLAYRLELDSPATAVTTVFIVALPGSGMVLEKAIFRVIGTLVGCIAAVVLVALLPQAAPLLFACLALWVGLCTAGAAVFRNSKSYGFLLAGYTACMIAIPAVDAPTLIFTLAVTRVTEVGLGLICSAIISDALFPRHQGDQVLLAVQGRYERFLALCRDTLENRLTPAQAELTHLGFAADIAALETTRSAAFFEAGRSFGESRNIHLFNAAFMTALTTFYTLHRLLHRMHSNASARVNALTDELSRVFLQAVAMGADGNVEAACTQIRQRAALLRVQALPQGTESNQERIALDTVIELLERFARNMYHFQQVYVALLQKKPLPERIGNVFRAFDAYAPRTPFPIVLASGLRTTVATLVLAAIWYILAWPYAAVAMLMTVIFTALAASSPNPPRMVRQIALGFVLGVPLAFICNFFLLSHAEGFAMLALCIAPFIAFGTYLTTMPKLAGIGLGLNLFLSQTVFPENGVHADPTAFMNNAIAFVLGAALAWLVFTIVLPRHTVGQKDYIAAALWREARRTCTALRPSSPHAFDNRIRDLLNQLNTGAGPAPDQATRAIVGQALTLLELGHSVINMRELMPLSPSAEVRAALQRCIAGISAFLRAPTGGNRAAVIEAILEAGRLVREERPGAAAERLPRLNMAYADLHSLYTLMLDHEQLVSAEGENRVA